MRGYAAVGLCDPKNQSNLGGVLRAASCYGAKLVVIVGDRIGVVRHNLPTDTPKTWRHTPVQRFSAEKSTVAENMTQAIPVRCHPVVIECKEVCKKRQCRNRLISLPDFIHPERAFYIFGPEDGNVPSRIMETCDPCVHIPTNGPMNLAAAVNVVLYDRMMKREPGRARGGYY